MAPAALSAAKNPKASAARLVAGRRGWAGRISTRYWHPGPARMGQPPPASSVMTRQTASCERVLRVSTRGEARPAEPAPRMWRSRFGAGRGRGRRVMKLPEDAITRLYAVPLDAFTRERNGLATALTKAGHADQARVVRQLRRPSAPLWATNQLARVDSERLEAFLDRRGADSKDSAARSAGGRRGPHPATARAAAPGAPCGRAAGPARLSRDTRCRTPHLGHAPRRRRRSRPRQRSAPRATPRRSSPRRDSRCWRAPERPGHLQLVRGGQPARPRDAQPEKAERGNVERRRRA